VLGGVIGKATGNTARGAIIGAVLGWSRWSSYWA
jgi:hypothetical protein